MLAAAILAAGESKRMGQPKALVPFQGSTFVEHLIAATRHARVGITRVVLGAGAGGIRAQLKIDPAWVVVNARLAEGAAFVDSCGDTKFAGGGERGDFDLPGGPSFDFGAAGGGFDCGV